MNMRFNKMHGCGNDFVVFVLSRYRQKIFTKTYIRNLCRRHFGIGADGVILVLPPADRRKTDFKMRIFNSDGSEAEMCGNGIRCLGKLVYDKLLTFKKELIIETARSHVPLTLFTKSDKVINVKVNLPEPELVSPLSKSLFKNVVNFKYDAIMRVSMGNPHCVIFTPVNIDKIAIEKIAPIVERNRLFPQRTNVEFVNIKSKSSIAMRVWERGVGETLACGSGACASVVAGVAVDRLRRDNVRVVLPGGCLNISWEKDVGIFMSGPAEHVFEGVISI